MLFGVDLKGFGRWEGMAVVGAELGGMYEQKPVRQGVTVEKGVLWLCNRKSQI